MYFSINSIVFCCELHTRQILNYCNLFCIKRSYFFILLWVKKGVIRFSNKKKNTAKGVKVKW